MIEGGGSYGSSNAEFSSYGKSLAERTPRESESRKSTDALIFWEKIPEK
jgi:hypothetical protein